MDSRFDNISSAGAALVSTERESLSMPTNVKAFKTSRKQVALLGTGYIAAWHARAIASVPGVELVAVCDQVGSRATTFAQAFGISRTYGDLKTMLANERLDSVHVLVPPDAHFEAARTILCAGVNAFIEKPMGTSPYECEKLVRLAQERELRLGVGHNFLFSECYVRLRDDIQKGVFGPIDQLTITWHHELPQATSGPFDIWMLREPPNIMLEVGSHCVAQMLDLVGIPDTLKANASNPVDLPTGQKFYRRWQVNAFKGPTAIELRCSFVPAFAEYTIQVRGSLAAATVDFDRNTYTLRRHRPLSEDFDRYAMVADGAGSARRQARRTLRNYVLSKLHLGSNGTPYGASIAAAMNAFYASGAIDQRISSQRCTDVIRVCEEIGRAALTTAQPTIESPARSKLLSIDTRELPPARTLVLGATGFIGRELTRRLIQDGQRVRVLVRSPGKLAEDLCDARLQCIRGDLSDPRALRDAMAGVECVYHLARVDARSWADYERDEIGVTRGIAEAAMDAGVKRLIYTGTIDSYYAGIRAGTITEDTALDPRIERRNLYARAKAKSEHLLMQMRRTHGLPIVILRPGIVIGRGGSPMHWGVGRWWYGAVCQTWGDGRNPLPLVLVEDVADALVLAAAVPGIEGESFNLVADPCLSAQDYLDEIDRFADFRIQRYATPILKFYLTDMAKWVVKVATRHADRRLPSYRDWESRRQLAVFDCTRAKVRLGWRPTSDRAELIRKGIHEPMKKLLG